MQNTKKFTRKNHCTKTHTHIFLDGTRAICLEEISKKFEVEWAADNMYFFRPRKIRETFIESNSKILKELLLRKVSKKELLHLRRNHQPGFVLKKGIDLYYTELQFSLPRNLLTPHQCGESCKRLSAAPDKYGGCSKIRNSSSCIEKYNYIQYGFETFNTRTDLFVVVECNHYEKVPENVSVFKTMDELDKAKKTLREFYKSMF